MRLLPLLLAACGGLTPLADRHTDDDPVPEADADTDADTDTDTDTDADTDADTDTDTDADTDTDTDADDEPPWTDDALPADIETECTGYELVYEQAGTVLELVEGHSSLDLELLDPGYAFYCATVEMDLVLPDNLDALAADFAGCPLDVPLVALTGTGATGQLVGAVSWHGMDDSCAETTAALGVTNYLDAEEVTWAKWEPGATWHLRLRVEPFFSRVQLFRGGVQIGPAVEALLETEDAVATIADSRDPLLSLGHPSVHGDVFPWYGAEIRNLRVWLDDAPPAE